MQHPASRMWEITAKREFGKAAKDEGGRRDWRRRWESNPRMTVLQTIALPLGYSAVRAARERFGSGVSELCQRGIREIALSKASMAQSSSSGLVQSGGMRTIVSRIGRVRRP